jgi:hypothetical protein
MRVSLAREQPMGVNPRDINQLQDNIRRHRDARLVIEPGFNRDIQGIGQQLGAVFPAQILANLSEPAGQTRLLPTIRVAPEHGLPPVLTG